MRLVEAELLLGPLGFSCFNPTCGRRANVNISSSVVRAVRAAGGRMPRSERGFQRCSGRRFQKCSVCSFAHYCSPSCQRADWRRHRRVCPPIRDEYRHDRRRLAERQNDWTSAFGIGSVYDFFLWGHCLEHASHQVIQC